MMMSFGQAATLVMDEPGKAAFAFYPSVEGEELTGGAVFILHRPEFDDGEDWVLDALIGRFGAGAAETYTTSPRDFKELVPEAVFGVDPRQLLYRAADEEVAMVASWCPVEAALAMLNGMTESAADTIELTNPDTVPTAWPDWLVAHLPESAFKERG
jgi:hypothetical protein